MVSYDIVPTARTSRILFESARRFPTIWRGRGLDGVYVKCSCVELQLILRLHRQFQFDYNRLSASASLPTHTYCLTVLSTGLGSVVSHVYKLLSLFPGTLHLSLIHI